MRKTYPTTLYKDFLKVDDFTILMTGDSVIIVKIDDCTVGLLFDTCEQFYSVIPLRKGGWSLGDRVI